MSSNKCCVFGCRSKAEIEIYGKGICDFHWSLYCENGEYWGKFDLWLEFMKVKKS